MNTCKICRKGILKSKKKYCNKCFTRARAEWQPIPTMEDVWDQNNPCFAKPLVTALHQLLLTKIKDPEFKLNFNMADNASIIAIADDKALLVLETNPANGKYLFGFPEGRRQKNENPLQTAMREWYEETGVILGDYKKLDIICRAKSGTADVIIVITVDKLDLATEYKHSALYMTMMSLFDIKQYYDQGCWFSVQIIEGCLTAHKPDEAKPDGAFRFRQCIKHGLDDVHPNV